MPILLFIALASAFLFLIVPGTVYQTSPAMLLVDEIKRRFEGRYNTGEKQRKLNLVGRELKELFQYGIVIGLSAGFLIGLIFYLIWPVLLPIGIILGLAAVILLVDVGIENEYKKFQLKMAEGTVPLADFMPSFLETEGITPREALMLSLPFIPNPLKDELEKAVSYIGRTGKVHEAMEVLTSKTDDPVVEAICFRLAAAWDAKVTADIFDDLRDELENMKEITVTNETNAKTAYLALLVVLGLIGGILIFGYPAWNMLTTQQLLMFN